MGAELPEIPGVHEIHHHAHGDRFGRWMAIVTVLATLCAAWVAVLQANAVRHHDDAAAQAQELAAETLGVRSTTEGAARVQLERFELAEQQRSRASLARQELLFAGGARAAALRNTEARWNDIADQTDRESETIAEQDEARPLSADNKYGPAQDPTFPLRYLAQSRHETYVLSAERQAANRKAARAEDQYSRFAVSFTVLVIAVFLFGYSLTPHGRPRRRLFAGTASLFVLVAATNAVVTTLEPPTQPPRAAAEAYAEGQVAADSSQPRLAEEHFTKAIRLDPGFADAYVARADATFLAHAPHALGSGAGVTTAEALDSVIADERKARSLGIRDPLFNAELGSDLLALGLHRHSEADLRDAADALQDAVAENETDAQAAYDLGAAQVALGRFDDARGAYRQAVERTVFVEHEGKRERRDDPISEEEDLAVGLEDLQNVAQFAPQAIAARVPALKRQLVEEVAAARVAEENAGEGAESGGAGSGKAASAEASAAEHVALHGVQVRLSPDATYFRIPAQEGFDPTRDRLSVQWYFEDPQRLGWTVLTELSSVSEAPLPAGSPPDYFERGPYLGLTTPAACLPAGHYRLEIYVDGAPAANVEKDFGTARSGAELRGLDAALCVPRGWRQTPERMPGLLDGYVSPDHSSGAYVLSLSPALIGASAHPSKARMGAVLDRVLARFGDLLPARPTNGTDRGPVVPTLEGALVRSYRVGSDRALAGIGQSRSGQLLVELLYGPDEMFTNGFADQIFASLADRA